MRRPVHNTHLQILTESGVIGFSVWLLMILYILRGLLRLWSATKGCIDRRSLAVRAYASSLVASISSFLVGSAFGNYAYNDLFWTIAALAAILIKISLNLTHAIGHDANVPAR